VLGALAAVVGAAAALMISNDPRARGLGPDGDPIETVATAGAPGPARPAGPAGPAGMSVREAVRSRRFIGLYLGCLICSFGLFVPFVHLDPYARDHGVPARWAVLLLSMIGIGSTAGRFILEAWPIGWGAGARCSPASWAWRWRWSSWLCSTAFWPLAAFAHRLRRCSTAASSRSFPALVMDYFGGRNISSIIGILYTSIASGTLIGPLAAGFAFRSQSQLRRSDRRQHLRQPDGRRDHCLDRRCFERASPGSDDARFRNVWSTRRFEGYAAQAWRPIRPLCVTPRLAIQDIACRAARSGKGALRGGESTHVVFVRQGAFAMARRRAPLHRRSVHRAGVMGGQRVPRVSHPGDAGDDCTVVELDG